VFLGSPGSLTATFNYDLLHVNAALNQIKGLSSSGTQIGKVPSVFGFNIQACLHFQPWQRGRSSVGQLCTVNEHWKCTARKYMHVLQRGPHPIVWLNAGWVKDLALTINPIF
jgi:hypothetical protein